MLWQIVLVIIVLWFIISHYFNQKDILELASHVPKFSSRSYPFVGQAYIMLGSDEVRMKSLQDLSHEAIENGGIVSIWFGRRFIIVISDAEIGEQILKTCLQKDDLMQYIRDVSGNGLIFAEKHIWRPRRKVMAPAFSPKNLNQFTEIFTRQSKIMVDNLKENCDEGDFSIFKYLTSYSMDAIVESDLGIDLKVQSNPNHPFIEAFDKASQVIAARVLQPWLQFEFIYRLTSKYRLMESTYKKQLFGFIEKIIKQKRKEIEEKIRVNALNKQNKSNNDSNNNERLTFMEMLLANSGGNEGYTDLELREEIMVLVLAGTDTSAVGASFTMLMLAKHDDVQAKLLKELREVFGDSDRPLTNEDFPKLKYLDAVIKESLRLYPPGPVIARKVENNYITLPTGLKLCPGTGMIISIWGIHRNPKYWGEDAEVFRPERFLEEKLKYPAAFMPFSYGPRNCIGYNYALMSIKVVVSTVLRRYQLLPALSNFNFAPHFMDGKKAKEMAKTKFDIMMKDSSNFVLRLQKR